MLKQRQRHIIGVLGLIDGENWVGLVGDKAMWRLYSPVGRGATPPDRGSSEGLPSILRSLSHGQAPNAEVAARKIDRVIGGFYFHRFKCIASFCRPIGAHLE